MDHNKTRMSWSGLRLGLFQIFGLNSGCWSLDEVLYYSCWYDPLQVMLQWVSVTRNRYIYHCLHSCMADAQFHSTSQINSLYLVITTSCSPFHCIPSNPFPCPTHANGLRFSLITGSLFNSSRSLKHVRRMWTNIIARLVLSFFTWSINFRTIFRSSVKRPEATLEHCEKLFSWARNSW